MPLRGIARQYLNNNFRGGDAAWRAGLESADTAAQWLVRRFTRYVSVSLALLGILIAAIAFVPQFLKFAAGTFPIA